MQSYVGRGVPASIRRQEKARQGEGGRQTAEASQPSQLWIPAPVSPASSGAQPAHLGSLGATKTPFQGQLDAVWSPKTPFQGQLGAVPGPTWRHQASRNAVPVSTWDHLGSGDVDFSAHGQCFVHVATFSSARVCTAQIELNWIKNEPPDARKVARRGAPGRSAMPQTSRQRARANRGRLEPSRSARRTQSLGQARKQIEAACVPIEAARTGAGGARRRVRGAHHDAHFLHEAARGGNTSQYGGAGRVEGKRGAACRSRERPAALSSNTS